MDTEKQLNWAKRADKIVLEAAKQNEVQLPDLLARALENAVQVHGLSQPGVYSLVEAYANSERQLDRLPPKDQGE
ncbi:MAG: hypothetical protein GY938_12475 [Ketobacter sp.]|nr:hypothetical protein [Ketobacter sp.]